MDKFNCFFPTPAPHLVAWRRGRLYSPLTIQVSFSVFESGRPNPPITLNWFAEQYDRALSHPAPVGLTRLSGTRSAR
jgi:hypothetical protein